MRSLSILAIISFLVSCGGRDINLPAYPDIKNYYVTSVKGQEIDKKTLSLITNVEALPQSQELASCLLFHIVSYRPFKFEFDKVVPLSNCNLVGGYAPEDSQKLLNWFDDVYIWSTRYKCYEKTN